jgi:surface antigen
MVGRWEGLAGRCAMAMAMIAAGLVIPVTTATTALASVSNSQDPPPVYSNWSKNPTNWPCYATPSYACAQGGYDNSSALASGWPNTYYGRGKASTNAYGMHNCTLYAAYRLEQNGFQDPGNWGNASNWAKAASGDHILVNQTPAVGSIAQWNAGGRGDGHVAFVESVSYDGAGAVTGITISEDNFMPETGYGSLNGGYTAEIHITAGARVWPANFIHAKDQTTPAWGSATEAPGTAVLNTGGDGRILSVSCPSDGNCAAGGEYKDGFGEQAFVLNDANGTWGSAEEVPGTAALNTGGGASIVTVSCVSAGDCAAGGYYSDGAGYQHALIVSEVNGTWRSARELPGVAALGTRGNSDVRSLSCASAGNCSASGFYWDGSAWQTFVATEVNGTWHAAKGLAGTAVSFESNQSLSCPSAGNCAVGGGFQQAFVANEVNGTWGKAEQVPGIATLNTGKAAAVVSVSCTSPGNCSAGGYSDSGHKVFVVNEVNGTWGKAALVPGTVSLNAGGTATISSVSCASPGNCSAGGGWDYVGSGGVQAFAATEVNGIWAKAEEVPGVAFLAIGGASAISSLSCRLPGYCSAVGEYVDGTAGWQAFAASEVDGTWGNAEELPGTAVLNVDEYAWPWAVSCASVGYCVAGGEYRDSHNQAQAFVTSQPPNP